MAGNSESVPVRICAHRGDTALYRENTLPAIRAAIAAAAEVVEVDVRVTADGAVIVLHDATLERLWGRAAAVADLPLAEVERLGDEDERPPLLAEVLELFEGTTSTLLIDMDDACLAEPAFRVAAAGSAGVAWCGDRAAMEVIRSLDSSARIWMPWCAPRPPTATDLATLAPECVNLPYLAATREIVDAVHALGCRVTLWTVDDEPAMRWAIRLGVDTITTNEVALLRRVRELPAPRSPQVDPRLAGVVDAEEALVVATGLARWAIDFVGSTSPTTVGSKSDAADLVTDLDLTVERYARAIIELHFPEHGFVGEETGGTATAGPCWYLDPIDGTANLANRIPWNAFSLALAVDRTPLIAVVADPWHGDLFEAVKGHGAWLNGRELCLSDRPVDDALQGRIVATELANQRPWEGMIALLEELAERQCTLRIMGSGTMALAGIADGRGVGAVIGSFGAVDHLAAALIVDEAGGVVLDSAGNRNLFPDRGGIMAAAPPAAADLHRLWLRSSERPVTMQAAGDGGRPAPPAPPLHGDQAGLAHEGGR